MLGYFFYLTTELTLSPMKLLNNAAAVSTGFLRPPNRAVLSAAAADLVGSFQEINRKNLFLDRFWSQSRYLSATSETWGCGLKFADPPRTVALHRLRFHRHTSTRITTISVKSDNREWLNTQIKMILLNMPFLFLKCLLNEFKYVIL